LIKFQAIADRRSKTNKKLNHAERCNIPPTVPASFGSAGDTACGDPGAVSQCNRRERRACIHYMQSKCIALRLIRVQIKSQRLLLMDDKRIHKMAALKHGNQHSVRRMKHITQKTFIG